MLTQLKNGFSGLRAKGLPPAALPAAAWRYLLPLLMLALALTVLVVVYLWHDDASYKPVFGEQEKVSAADMMAVLDAEKIPYRLHPQSGQVLVPEAQLGRVRMQLAGKGVVAQLPAGLELLDNNDPLGVSQFVQDVRFRRGLEGELVQSILALEPVRAARVHLSLPKSSAFVGASEDKGSASVVVTLKAGQSLSNEQVSAIVKLVSGSVSTLDPARVTLVDQAGNLLSARLTLAEGGTLLNESDSERRHREQALENVRALLAPVVGADNFRVSIAAEVDNDRVNETREKYGEAPKVTNEASREEKTNEKAALGIPGSLSNLPIDTDASMPVADSAAVSKNAVTRQYAYDRSIMQIQHARGELSRLSVAVVLNEGAAPNGKAWTPAQLAGIDKLLRGGLGIKAERGDALVLSALAFPAQAAPLPWWEEGGVWLPAALSWAGYAISGLLLYLLLARPLLKLLRQRLAAPLPAALPVAMAGPEPLLLTPDDTPQPAPADERAAVAALPDPTAARSGSTVVPLLENYDLPPAGSSVDVLVDHLKHLAAKEPERVAEVVKQWVQKNGRTQ
ncbi:flagellar basal-body MS-ring/collar protein FliF [Vogesella alkaliphila]|uniref:Flagellar M-ring protein n=1 Tax=Vogesella alkaliphila TaxID=1193621 RepID=A0ABQ2YFT8_9NEIS|nr:flagellar basal-body MS-ring/collar protein FliF [Vogesella alkaliphila]GGX82845.1 flagellar M-ring protein [Vogesella alkaliphila]